MDKIQITGGVALKGAVEIGGAKNAALPLMAACLLSDEPITLSNIPHLSDITTMANLLVSLGADFSIDGKNDNGNNGRVLNIGAKNINNLKAPYDIVRKMRASIVVMGPLLARFGEAEISLPGGCAIGARPINFHLDAFKQMGAQIELADGYIKATISGKLQGAEINFAKVSVGATENILMAATLAEGQTILNNAACEPEITDLANCLNKMGAKILGIGTTRLIIDGVEKLHSAKHEVVADRIEAGTYAVAAAITGGEVALHNINANILESTLELLEKSGVEIERGDDFIGVKAGKTIKTIHVETEPYPGFPTDMQAQFAALMCVADGKSTIDEHIFENRFMHIPELQRMGANIDIDGNRLQIHGSTNFHGAEVMATDLRASVSLVLAALTTKETTNINRVYHIDRGYERIEEKLSLLGANIVRVKGSA